MKNLLLKVCGMREPNNIQEVVELKPDFMGFIFYKKSPRYIGNLESEILKSITGSIRKVGVFVNASLKEIEEAVEKYGLDYVQLHGEETFDFAKQLKERGIKVIKVFSVTDKMPEAHQQYEGIADFLLFDTATKGHGGSGQQFDWNMLDAYDADTPLLLSGGIGSEDLENIKQLEIKNLVGIDVNSRFEIAPAEKDVKMLKELKDRL